MKQIFGLFAVFAFGNSAYAAATTRFNCQIEANAKKVFETSVVLANAPESQVFFRSAQFEMKLSRTEQNEFTLEIYDRIQPKRSYANANIRQISDKLAVATWEREGMIDVVCRLTAVSQR